MKKHSIGIRRRFVEIFLLSMLPMIALTILGLAAYLRTEKELLLDTLDTERFGKIRFQINLFWESAGDDTRLLTKVPPVEGILRCDENGGTDPRDGTPEIVWRERLTEIFTALLFSRQAYDQVRFLDRSGLERVHVKWSDGGTLAVSQDRLKNRKDSMCFIEASRLKAGDLYVSAVELPDKSGDADRSIKPVLRFAMPIYNEYGRFSGVIVLHALVRKMMGFSEGDKQTELPGEFWFITDQNGDYLHHSNAPSKEWGGTDAALIGGNLERDFPDIFRDLLGGSNRRLSFGGTDFLIKTRRFDLWKYPDQFLVVGHAVPYDAYIRPVSALTYKILAYFGLVLFITGGLGWIGSRRISSPLDSLVHVVDEYQSGRFDLRTQLRGPREIEELSFAFNRMADALAERHTNLEREVDHRTRDLEQSRRAALHMMEEAEKARAQTAESLESLRAATENIRKLSRAVEQSPSSIVITDRTGRIEYINPAFSRNTGYSFDEAVGGNPRILKSGKHDAEFYKAMWATLVSGKEWRGELCNRKKSGELYWESVSIAPVIDSEGTITHYIAVKEEITRIKEMQERLARELDLNTALAELYEPLVSIGDIPDMAAAVLHKARILTRSEHGFVGTIDPETKNLVTHTLTEMVAGECTVREGERQIEFSPGPDGRYPHLWGQCLNTGLPFYTNAPGQHPSSGGVPKGHVTLNNFLSVPVLLGAEVVGQIAVSNTPEGYSERDFEVIGRLAAYFALAIQRVRDEDSLEKARLSAEAANRAKSVFLSNMSHEIRTPLNAILGFSQLLARDPELTPPQREQVETINRSGAHLLGLINDILEISRIEAGRITLNIEIFSLYDLLRDLEMMFRSRCEAKGLSFGIELDPDLPKYVSSDQSKLRQVCINLLGNAVKFTSRGSVVLRIQPARETGPFPGDAVLLHVEVEDTGVGISEDDQGRLFKAFEQSQAGMKAGGTGLGLAISREYVRIMGGDIRVRSEAGKGSLFAFDVRVRREEEGLAEALPPSKRVLGLEPETGPVRVLVADDNPENRALIKGMLAPVGFEVKEAENGREALEIFSRYTPHAVLMDMWMPEMDGYEVTRRLKLTEEGKKVPVIAVTASAFEEGKKRAMEAGADAFLRKPFREEELLGILGTSLGLRYVYAEIDFGGRGDQKKSETIKPGAATVLPDSIRAELQDALEEGDMMRFTALLGGVEKIDAGLARDLRAAADMYDYEKLKRILGKGDEHDE